MQNGRDRMGEKVQVSLADGRAIPAAITKPVFLDPEGARQNASMPSSGESPLARFRLAARATRAPGGAGVVARERAFLGYLNLRGNAQDPRFVGAVSDVVGDGLPIVANTLTEVLGVTMYWLGPDEWLIVTPGERRAAIEGELRRALAVLRVAITDVSGGQTLLQLHGARIRDVLAEGLPHRPASALVLDRTVRAEPSRQGPDPHRPGRESALLRGHLPAQLRRLPLVVAHDRGGRIRPRGSVMSAPSKAKVKEDALASGAKPRPEGRVRERGRQPTCEPCGFATTRAEAARRRAIARDRLGDVKRVPAVEEDAA